LIVKSIKAFFLLISQKSSNFAADFKNNIDMKKIIYLLLLAATMVVAGCEKQQPHTIYSIMGKTYRAQEGAEYVSVYFAPNYTCSYSSYTSGQYTSTSQLVYKIVGTTTVDIYTDNSSAWDANYRNTRLFHLVYIADDDELLWDGLILKPVN